MATIVGTPVSTDYGFTADRNAVNLSAGIQADDVIWFVLTTANTHSLGSIPADVTQYGTTQDATGGDSSTSVLYRIATGSEGSTFNLGTIFSAAESGGVYTFVLRGLNTADLIEAGAQGVSDIAGASGSISAPSITPVNNGCTILFIAGCDPASSAITATPDTTPSATEIFDAKADTGDWHYGYVQKYEQATAGAIALDADVSYGPLNFAVFQIALNNGAPSTLSVDAVDTDNAVDQYQLVNIDVTNFTETITSVLFDTEPVVSIPDNDASDNIIQVRVPGNLATGTYDVTVSGATESATINGISYTQTHPINIPTGPVDSNSILTDQGLGVGYAGDAYMTNPPAPYEIDAQGGVAVPAGEVMAFKAPYTDWSDSPIQNDIMDYLAAPEDFAGWMRADFERLYSDGTTAAWSVETLVSPPPQVVSVSKPLDGTYGQGQTLQFTATFDYPATVTGTPRLELDFEGAVKYAAYVSGSSTTALVFEYVVQDGDYAPSGIIITSLGLNGGTIANGAGQAAVLTLNGVPVTSGVLAGTAPHQVVDVDDLTVGGNSATVTVSYPDTNLTGYEYRLDGGAWTPTSNPIQLNSLSGSTLYDLDIAPVNEFGRGGATSIQFTTSAGVDTTPLNFAFTAQTGVALGDTVQSNTITILGVDAGADVPVSISGDASSQYRVSTDNGVTWAAWTATATNVRLNYQIQVRHDAAGSFATDTDTVFTAGGVARTFRSTTLADAIFPTITLTGGNLNWPQGTPFVDPGYIATDNADGNITADVVVTGVIDENTLGPQNLTYTVQDAALNETSVTRTVTIVSASSDLIKPVITLDGGNVDWPLGTPWVDPGFSATDNVDGNLTAQVQVSSPPNVNAAGPYTVSYSVTDNAGNVGTATRTVTVVAADVVSAVLAPSYRTVIPEFTLQGGVASELFYKAPQETLDFDIDLTQWILDEADDVDPAQANLAVTVDVAGLGIDSFMYLDAEDRIKVWLGSGVDGVGYTVSAFITTTSGRRKKFLFRVAVQTFW